MIRWYDDADRQQDWLDRHDRDTIDLIEVLVPALVMLAVGVVLYLIGGAG